ncbi:MAG: proteasome protein [Richelia sp. RM1_1_1]|nr:proteasome protein [Richelia sp. RM1_1_1]
MELDKLEFYKEKAELILKKLDSVPQNLYSQGNWVPSTLDECVNKYRKAAERVTELATSPVKIGLMGEFNAGKTLLLGNLIGFADALPVSENPTTGNVTAIHLIPQEGFQTTQVDNYTVHYLTRDEVNECLGFMLKEASRRAKAVGLSSAPQTTLQIDSILGWCEEVWSNSKNLELRYLLRELVGFIRVYTSYGTALCGCSRQIDASIARDGLKLPDMPMAIQNLSFQELPRAPIPLPNAPGILQVKLLQNSFSLIKRIDIQVKISREIWNIPTHEGVSEFILMDFPGLGAANSGVRDRFLSLKELKDVQTVLLLLNGKSSGSDRANEIFTMMQQERPKQDLKDLILVGVGRFNQLPLESEGGERLLDKLIENNASLDEANVFQKLDVLRTTIDQASAFTTEKDRIVLLDQLMGIADLAKRSSNVKVASQEFLANLDYPGFLEQSKRMRRKWELLSNKLLASKPPSILGKQLGYFAEDGGIGRLRELIQTHVSTHGQRQLYEDVTRAYNILSKQQQELKTELTNIEEKGIPISESQAVIDLRNAIQTLNKVYENFKANLGNEGLKNRAGITVEQTVKDETIFRVHDWNQWTLLFNKANNGIITLGQSKKGAASRFDRGSKTDNSIPTTSSDFYPKFEKTVKNLKDFATELIYQAVKDLLAQFSNQITSERDLLKTILRPEMEQKIEATFDSERADLFFALLHGYDPNDWQKDIIKEINSEETLFAATMFPLARPDEKHQTGRIFDWAPERSQDNKTPANHLLLVLRLQDEIIASASLHLVQYVNELNKQVNDGLMSILGEIIPALQELPKKEDLLRYIADGESPTEAGSPAWLKTLSEIADLSL